MKLLGTPLEAVNQDSFKGAVVHLNSVACLSLII